MLHVALFEPEIAGNTGNIARTCLASGAQLHLIRPLGFRLNDAAIKRAGMDYWQDARVTVHSSYAAFAQAFDVAFTQQRVFALSTKATRGYHQTQFHDEDVLLFGPESRGLPGNVRNAVSPLRIPMTEQARSLNVSVSVSIVLFEAWRQLGFTGGA